VLLLSVDLLTGWASFLIREQASLQTVLRLMLYKLPGFLHLSLPIAVVFAILISSGRLAKDSELKAAYSLGATPLKMLLPFLLLGLIVSLLALANNGFIEPLSQRAYERLEDSFFYNTPPPETQTNSTYLIEGGGIFYASRVRASEDDPDKAELSGVVIMKPDGSLISAANGTWFSSKDNGYWQLTDAEIVSKDSEVSYQAQIDLPFNVSLKDSSLSSNESLTLPELEKRIKELEKSKSKTRQLYYDFHSRIADAFSALIFAFVSAILGLQLHGRAGGFAWTIVLLVVFWAIWILSASMFDKHILSAAAAAWLTTGVVGSFAVVLAYLRLR